MTEKKKILPKFICLDMAAAFRGQKVNFFSVNIDFKQYNSTIEFLNWRLQKNSNMTPFNV